jgi:hypothetical protein
MKRAWLLLLLSLPALANSPDAGTKKHAKGSDFDLGIPTFGEIPKGNDLTKPKAQDTLDGPTVTATGALYSVVRVQHAKAFLRSPTGAMPAGGALDPLPLSGKPLSTEKFTTVIRVKSPQRASGSIELAFVDGRGETLMSSRGELTFRGQKGDEVDYTIDWDPTPCRAGGEFTLNVQIGGQSVGTFPVKFAEPPAK